MTGTFKKRALSLLLALAVSVSGFVGAEASAAEPETAEETIAAAAENEGDFEYSVNEDGETVTITKYNGTDTEVDIPGTLDGKNVTVIGEKAFYKCTTLTDVTIPDSVTTIGKSAFYGCQSLTTVTIPDSVTTIGNEALCHCQSLTSVTISDNVTTIGFGVFTYTESLESIIVGENNKNYSSTDGILFNKNKTVIIRYPAGKKEKSYIIPDSVTTIDRWAFCGCKSLTNVTIPYGVTEIGASAFSACTSLTSVIIPDSVQRIGEYAFEACTSLTSITLSDSVTTIMHDAFWRCTSLTSVIIPDSVTTINAQTFAYCSSLTSITIPESVTQIGREAFSRCDSLETVYYGGTMAKWEAIVIDELNECLTNAQIICTDGIINEHEPQPGDTFAEGDLEYKVLDDGTLEVKGFASEELKETAKAVTIPEESKGKKVTSIGNRAFSECVYLTFITIPDSVTSIGDKAFYRCIHLTSVTIPGSVISIGDQAFGECGKLTSITIPDSVVNMGESIFYACTKLESATLPKGLTSINIGTFQSCTSLTSITIPDSVTSIGRQAFNSCKSLTSITIPKSVTNIDDAAFVYCTGLTSVTIPDGVTSINICTFECCTGITSITIPNGVTSIGQQAFSQCESLISVTIPDSVTNIGSLAFRACTSLNDVYFGGSKSQWEKITIDFFDSALLNATIHFAKEDIVDGSLFDKENETIEKVETPPEAADIPESDRVTSITINPAFNMKNKEDDNVELDLTKIKIKAQEIYDEEGLNRASEALGTTISGNTHYNLLDLTLLYDGKDFSNGYVGLVQVIIPIPTGHRDKTFSCYRLTTGADGKTVKELIPGEQTEDSYIIYLEHFSEYALVGVGDEDGHGHTWNSGEVTTPATTAAAGVKTYTCTVCGSTKTESIPKLSSSGSSGSSGSGYRPSSSSGSSNLNFITNYQINSLIDSAKTGDIIEIENNVYIFPETVKNAADKKVELKIKVDDMFTWLIDAEKITDTSAARRLFASSAEMDKEQIAKIEKSAGVVDKGEMSFTIIATNLGSGSTLNVKTSVKPAANVPQFANLYKAKSDGTLEFAGAALIDENGFATLPIADTGTYTIVISGETKLTGDIDNNCRMDIADVSAALKQFVNAPRKLTRADSFKLDFNNDNQITIGDVSGLLHYFVNGCK